MPRPRNEYESAIAKKRRGARRRGRFALFLFCGAAVVAVVIFVCIYPRIYINAIRLNGFQFSDETAVRQTTIGYLDQNVAGIIPRWNRLVTGTTKLEKVIKETYPAFADVKARIRGRTLTVSVNEHTAAYLWCELLPDGSSDIPHCAYMDGKGLLFAEAPYFSEPTQVVYYTASHTVGDSAVDTKIIQTVNAYQTLLGDFSFVLHAVSVDEFGVKLVGTFADTQHADSIIMIDPDTDAKTTVSYLHVLFNDATFKKELASKALEYIDAEYGKTLYYKFD